MDFRVAVVIALVTVGLAGIIFGLTTGDQGFHSMEVGDPLEDGQRSEFDDVREFDYLSPAGQDAFLQALETGDSVRFDGSGPLPNVVQYRDQYYRTWVVVGDASNATMVFWLGAGLLALVLAVVAWRDPRSNADWFA